MNYTINELANLFGITTNKARFYEKKGLVQPKRNPSNDYRMYSEDDVLKMQTILMYRSIGMPINQIQSLLSEENQSSYVDHFNHLWELTIKELQRIKSIKKTLEKVMDELYVSDINHIQGNIINHIQNDQKIFSIQSDWKDEWNFDNWAETYDRSIDAVKGKEGIYLSYDKLLELVTDKTSEEAHEGDLVLDIGIGTGNLTEKLLSKKLNVMGVDQSRNMLCAVKKKMPQLKVRLGDFMNLPFENNTFERIATTYAFHHLKDHEKVIALEEMLRVLKVNGRIVIGDMMFESDRERTRLMSLMTENEIEEVNDEYYSNIEHLKTTVESFGCTLKSTQVDKICWVVEIIKK